jgi:hypothetical protein
MSTELGKCYIGVERLLEIAEFAETFCIHQVNLNHNCPECDLDDQINGQNDSEAASEESFGRINP